MPKVSVYLPDDLYREARDRELPLSALAQGAIEAAIRRARATDWVSRMRTRPSRATRALDITGLMDDVRDEFGA